MTVIWVISNNLNNPIYIPSIIDRIVDFILSMSSSSTTLTSFSKTFTWLVFLAFTKPDIAAFFRTWFPTHFKLGKGRPGVATEWPISLTLSSESLPLIWNSSVISLWNSRSSVGFKLKKRAFLTEGSLFCFLWSSRCLATLREPGFTPYFLAMEITDSPLSMASF